MLKLVYIYQIFKAHIVYINICLCCMYNTALILMVIKHNIDSARPKIGRRQLQI